LALTAIIEYIAKPWRDLLIQERNCPCME